MFDPTREPATPIQAASVILLRETNAGAIEVFLVRRHRRSGFMASAFVFPGGKLDPEDPSPRHAAARELFEEAGVLFCSGPAPAAIFDEPRRKLVQRETTWAQLCTEAAVTVDESPLQYWARWITPSAEPKRFDATFYVAVVPEGQIPAFDNKETTEELWIRPAEALRRQAEGDLVLPPPQLRTMVELAACEQSAAAIAAEGAHRERHAHPFVPRFAETGGHTALLLPWDPDYESGGQGESLPMPPGHPLGQGPSRFVLEGMSWTLVNAPSSPPEA